ncbi:50S ribosomal protein L11 [Patescibacteria group bacterium]|nr:50S ribosomal protein L11 [Patescibacteria group bacterium]MBU4452947.1 50S ribosomal protein L11 [Patescibacteria group bacterium]
MAKPIKVVMKVQAMGGAATPAPPLGPALSQHGVNIQQFVNDFNNATQDRRGEIVPAVLTIYEDRSFAFILKTAPASDMIKKAAGIKSGSGKPNTEKVGTITKAQLQEIAEKKMPDLNTDDVKAAMKIIAGTCKQMGVDIK